MSDDAQVPIRSTAIKAARIDPASGVYSMAHMRVAMTRKDDGGTPAMRWGRLCHIAVLEPLRLAKLPRWDGPKRGNGWAEFKESLVDTQHEDYIDTSEIEALERIRDAAQRRLSGLPSVVATETELNWTDDLYGKATARIDALLKGGGMLDVKTCSDITAHRFLSQQYRLGTHVQFGWYDCGLRQNGHVGQRYVLSVESSDPYTTALYQVGDERIRDGYNEAEHIAKMYRVCEAVGTFPGPYDSDTIEYDIPAWAKNEPDEPDMKGIGDE